MNKIAAIILAAGKGTRMKSQLPKVLHLLSGLPLLSYSLEICKDLNIEHTIVVVGKKNKKDIIQTLSAYSFRPTVQDPPLGTGHAVLSALKELQAFQGDILILYGDMPLLQKGTIEKLIQKHQSENATVSFITAHMDSKIAFGRVIRNNKGHPLHIIEYKDATDDQKQITEMNVGVYLISSDFLKQELKKIGQNNAQGEYYLTDLILLANQQQKTVTTLTLNSSQEACGVNSQIDLVNIQEIMTQNNIQKLSREGIRFLTTENIIIEAGVKIGSGTVIYGPCYLTGSTRIGKNCILEPGVFLKDTKVKDHVIIKAYSYATEAIIDKDAQIGPFAHLRPGAHIGPRAKIGNFVEIKKSVIREGAKVNHLTYIGDAYIGRHVNVGAGTITCNYDGVNKYKTIIGDDVFIGSDTQFVAPIKVGKGAYIGAGSTITKNISSGSLALTRSSQIEIKNWKEKRKQKKQKK